MSKLLDKISSPIDVHKFSNKELTILSNEIREFLIDNVLKTGGHLSSNLGVVELTLSLYKNFNLEKDKIVWDVGHQSYVHKMLSGRKNQFSTLRKYKGISGFPKISESEYDAFGTGHSSTSISAALGIARARDILKEDYNVVAVIGDGALTGGMALEAINDLGFNKSKMIIILNDNQMSISKNVGALSNHLNMLRVAPNYNKIKNEINQTLNTSVVGKSVANSIHKIKDSIKNLVVPSKMFEEMGLKYIGPIDGHDIELMNEVLTRAKQIDGPVLIHVITKKGKGYELAEENPNKYHGVSGINDNTEKNNDILKNALQTSRRLGQLLSNMQDGMRSYFEELSQKKNFIGIQKVLVEEINNSDSKKYAILTTTDSFYRYKEAVKELVSQILRENDQKREQLVKERTGLVEGTVTSKRNQYRLEYCESASQLVYQVEREFDLIEKKYNKLIEQKTVFAKRALARIHYILQEGSSDEDHIVKLINLLDHHANSPQVLEQMRDRIRVGTQFKNITDRSFYNRKNAEDAGFHPIAMEKHNEETQMTDFVPKPLYTKKQLQEFRQKNIVDGRFVTDEQTIQSVEDLEKLLFLWQEETDDTKQEETVHIDGELKGEYGFVFSKLVIDAKKGEKK